jgi:lipopolysaccharide/colanic/teichoic acid biosynthesis glycosyltransferase/glycosyltransferase involved in cell wall biosynthesis
MLLESICTISSGLIVYHHALYPPLLRKLAGICGEERDDAGIVERPTVTLIVPAYNEARFIADKIENIAALDFPSDRLKIFIVCDGSVDATAMLAKRKIAELGEKAQIFELIAHAKNRGKVAVLNETISTVDADLVALTDASASLPRNALTQACRHFFDHRVGVVTGEYVVNALDLRARAYWNYQVNIKAAEAALGTPIGMHGAFYVFRRALWRPLEPDTINDDVILPMRIIASGSTGIYDRSIRVLEKDVDSFSVDMARRERLGAGAVQQIIRLWRLADPRRPGVAFSFLSGKALRAFMPLLLLVAFITNAILAGTKLLWMLTFLAQLILYGVALAGLVDTRLARMPMVGKLSYFLGGYTMAMIGAAKYLVGGKREAWKRISGASSLRQEGVYLENGAIKGKRVLDCVIASCALIVLAILYVPIAVAIKIESRGPVFYRQLRVGLRTAKQTNFFHLTKFRTMRSDAEARTGAVWASTDDPRVTRVGRFLRKTRLDELPQCFDVLRGDMSIVGPRPERPQFFRWLEAEIPFYAERTYGLKPGITGLAQVKLPYDSSIEDVRAKVLHDHAYALQLAAPGNWLWTDISIMLRTFSVMILGKGR